MRRVGQDGKPAAPNIGAVDESKSIKPAQDSESSTELYEKEVPTGETIAQPLTEEHKSLRKSQKKASGMIKQAAFLGSVPTGEATGVDELKRMTEKPFSDDSVPLTKQETRGRSEAILHADESKSGKKLSGTFKRSAYQGTSPDLRAGAPTEELKRMTEKQFPDESVAVTKMESRRTDEPILGSVAPNLGTQTGPRKDVLTSSTLQDKNVESSADESAIRRKNEKRMSGMLKQARLLGSLPAEKKTEETAQDDWVVVPKEGEVTIHKKIEIKEDYDPRARRPTIKRVKAEEFFAKRPPGTRPRAVAHKEDTLPEMALDKRAPILKATVGERPTPDSVAMHTTFSSLFFDKNAHLRDYFRHSQEPVAPTRKGIEEQFRRLDASLAQCEKEFGETVTHERTLLRETVKDVTLLSSGSISSPAHAMELKRLGLQPSVAGRVGKFTDVHLQEEMTKLGGGAVHTVYAGKYTLPGKRDSFEGVYKPEIPQWDKATDDIPAVVYDLGIDIKNPRLGYRNVATTRLDEMLKFGLTTRSEMAIHQGRLGTVSERAAGVSPQGPLLLGSHEHSAREMNFEDPRLRRDLVRLQFMDHIAGQADRHHGNYFVKQDSKGVCHGVMGIDNDLSWGKKLTRFDTIGKDVIQNPVHLPRFLPPVIDREGYKAIMALTPSAFAERMGGLLASDEIGAAGKRLKLVQEHLLELDKAGRVLDSLSDWKGDAIGKLLAEKKEGEFVTYLGRDAYIQEQKRKTGALVPYPAKH